MENALENNQHSRVATTSLKNNFKKVFQIQKVRYFMFQVNKLFYLFSLRIQWNFFSYSFLFLTFFSYKKTKSTISRTIN